MRFLLLVLTLALTPNTYAFDVPLADGFVTDSAGILSADQERSLEVDLQNYRGETSNEIAVFIVNSLEGEAISDVAVEIGREWGVGSAERNNGLLLLIAIEDRKLFIATGYGLEGAVPDLAAKQIIDREIVPEFKSGSYYGGITAGIKALKEQIGGEYEASSTSDTDGVPTPVWIGLSIFGLFFFFVFYQFFIGVLITISPSRSWWEGGILGGIFGFFFGGFIGMIVLAAIGAGTDFLASMLYLKYKPFREFLKKQKKKMKNREGVWFIGGGRGGGGSSGGGGSFGGGSFGGGGAGSSW